MKSFGETKICYSNFEQLSCKNIHIFLSIYVCSNFKFIKIEFQFSKFHPTLLIFTRFSLNTSLIAYANANRTMSPRGK